MKTQFANRRKLISLSVFLLAILFFVFFDRSKHVNALAEVNPFSVDPFDAVGSFGVQFALFTALLSLVRVYRPYTENETNANQELLILRSEITTVLSISVTLGADIVSMVRYLSVWIPSPAGRTLAAMVGGMAVVTALTGWQIFRCSDSQLGRGSWRPGAIICPTGVLILAVYPSVWDEGFFGGISTALLGMVLFFIVVWALSIGISPEIDDQYEDSIDDLGAIYRWIKAHAVFVNGLFQMDEKFIRQLPIRSILGWLDLRKHAWNFVILAAIAMGIALALAEAIGEGVSPIPGRFAIVMAVFIGIEGAGILFGYALLARFLGIYRKTKSV
jgi:hypothetical protein